MLNQETHTAIEGDPPQRQAPVCTPEAMRRRTWEIFNERRRDVYVRTDRLFIWLLAAQWAIAVVVSLLITPEIWDGAVSNPRTHFYTTVCLGGLLACFPALLAVYFPGRLVTRLIISGAQAGFSVLFIHLSGGRIETHFHVFCSLAILSTYHDFRVLIPATIVILVDHFIRGYFWPQSVFGVLTFSIWRPIEHGIWIFFEDLFLGWSCFASERGFWHAAEAQAGFESTNAMVEKKIELRTRQLADRTKKLELAHRQEVTLRNKLLQAQRLESIGELAAGVAHEINTPMQYLNDNLSYLSDCTRAMFDLLEAYESKLSPDGGARAWEERKAEIEAFRQQCHFDYMCEQVPQAVSESMEGIQRVISIVRAMKEFAHPGTIQKVSTDINQALRTTATISKNRWKYCADLVLDLSDDLPDVKTLPSEINQVLLNLVVNAGDAIASKLGDEAGGKGTITVRTYAEDEHVVIAVQDTGCGIPEGIQHRVYDMFFTTKEVGKGTGQGLAISHNIVVKKHGGQLDFETVPGEGTTFYVRLPATTGFTKSPCENEDSLLVGA
jgi:signal transduction histidine kinase